MAKDNVSKLRVNMKDDKNNERLQRSGKKKQACVDVERLEDALDLVEAVRAMQEFEETGGVPWEEVKKDLWGID